MSELKPSETPITLAAQQAVHRSGVDWHYSAAMISMEMAKLELENQRLREHCFADDSDSVVASCNCNTKTPEIQHHKRGCKYRLITERDALKAELEQIKEDARDQGFERDLNTP